MFFFVVVLKRCKQCRVGFKMSPAKSRGFVFVVDYLLLMRRLSSSSSGCIYSSSAHREIREFETKTVEEQPTQMRTAAPWSSRISALHTSSVGLSMLPCYEYVVSVTLEFVLQLNWRCNGENEGGRCLGGVSMGLMCYIFLRHKMAPKHLTVLKLSMVLIW